MFVYQITSPGLKGKKVSIIIPVLNEEHYLPQVLSHLKKLDPPPFEIIAVDGGSKDRTIPLLMEHKIFTCQTARPSRSIQMNMGAKKASGDILVFLHADTWVSENLISKVSNYMKNEKIALGGFVSIMKGKKNRPFVSGLNFIKTWLWTFVLNPKRLLFNGLKIIFGDQVMFCRRYDFEKIGGFNENYPILEDAELCLRMNRLGRIKQFPEKVYSSDRRVEKQGFLKAFWVYVFIAVLWTIGFPPEMLAKHYKHIR
jgi:rSAM/selenodomain-associated transferase 2